MRIVANEFEYDHGSQELIVNSGESHVAKAVAVIVLVNALVSSFIMETIVPAISTIVLETLAPAAIGLVEAIFDGWAKLPIRETAQDHSPRGYKPQIVPQDYSFQDYTQVMPQSVPQGYNTQVVPQSVPATNVVAKGRPKAKTKRELEEEEAMQYDGPLYKLVEGHKCLEVASPIFCRNNPPLEERRVEAYLELKALRGWSIAGERYRGMERESIQYSCPVNVKTLKPTKDIVEEEDAIATLEYYFHSWDEQKAYVDLVYKNYAATNARKVKAKPFSLADKKILAANELIKNLSETSDGTRQSIVKTTTSKENLDIGRAKKAHILASTMLMFGKFRAPNLGGQADVVVKMFTLSLADGFLSHFNLLNTDWHITNTMELAVKATSIARRIGLIRGGYLVYSEGEFSDIVENVFKPMYGDILELLGVPRERIEPLSLEYGEYMRKIEIHEKSLKTDNYGTKEQRPIKLKNIGLHKIKSLVIDDVQNSMDMSAFTTELALAEYCVLGESVSTIHLAHDESTLEAAYSRKLKDIRALLQQMGVESEQIKLATEGEQTELATEGEQTELTTEGEQTELANPIYSVLEEDEDWGEQEPANLKSFI